ncbi:hypothetical protein [Solimicrobium silvestre]|uniref:hypothetical protein n=1 Tax=Solimicrobium silvestre TaxID=2099400 RepID=UPI001056F4C1|nr:hypothetical protein [Solimicrobium silvestre]
MREQVLAFWESERWAREWFDHKGYDHFDFPQTPGTMPISLSKCGGKRPDFAFSLNENESLVYVDAKFHATNNITEFGLTVEELKKYEAFKKWALNELQDDGERDIILMLYPQELNGDRFTWILLDELLAEEDTIIDGKPAKKASLLGREDFWIGNP